MKGNEIPPVQVDFNIEFCKNLPEVHYMLAILHFFSLDRRVL